MLSSFDIACRSVRSFGALGFAGLVLFVGCSSSTAASPAAADVDAGTGTDAGGVAPALVLNGDPFTVPPGGDVTRCTAVRGTNTTAMFTNRFTNKQSGHHEIIYVVDHPLEPGSFVCPQGGQWNWSEIFGSQAHEGAFKLPDGVGYKLEPNQQFVIETHVINPTDKPIESTSEFRLEFVEESAVKYRAAPIFIGTSNIAIEPHANGHAGATCTLPSDVQFVGFFGHAHRRATQLSVARVKDGTADAPFYTMDAWDTPRVLDTVDVKTGDTLKVDCDYHNESDKKLGYPEEMCFGAALYWPANGTLICQSYGGNPDCKCFQPINPNLGTGGSTVTINVSRAATIANAKGDLAEGRPVYCYLYRKEDMDKDGPINAKLAYWGGTQIAETKPLATESDNVQLTLRDVTPGEYVATCMMDTLYGGYFPGSGSPIVFPYAPLTVGSEPVSADLKLNVSAP